MNYQELLSKTEEYVNLFFSDNADASLFYHNQSHTLEVLENSKQIANHYHLDDSTFFVVCAAACFHDISHLITNVEMHEMESAKMARTFLTTLGVNETDIVAIEKCIMATQIPQKPESLAEKILCDADLYNLGTDGFAEKNELLKEEMEALGNTKIDDLAWHTSSVEMLENHHYHTDYCQQLLNKKKAANLKQLRSWKEKEIKKAQSNPAPKGIEDLKQGAIEGVADNNPTAKPKKKDRPMRGVETMFRIVATKNIKISEMADRKANIMISINSIIVSVILGLMAGTLRENQNLIIPIIILLAVNVGTIIFSVLATRPKISKGVFTPDEVERRSVNLLYFGSFYKMNFKEYNEGLKVMMEDSDFLFGTLSKDTYWQGRVLGRKYRLLRISYTIFLYGIVVAVLAFVAAIVFFK